ncbi:hypothetical protein [Roseateles sp. BYS87W]|uniref:hypothetical protein n=1 Tax=Pelomonas baiyunensis TaxID=3299026 RepID=UPI00374A6BA5
MFTLPLAATAAVSLATLPAAGWCQSPAACTTPSLGALTQRMGKAWLCTNEGALAQSARQVLDASQTAFTQQLVQLHQQATSPEQAGGLRALARRYEDYQALLAGTPTADAHRQLLGTANEMLTLAQLATGSRAGLPWQARLAARQRLLSQRIALLGLANPAAEPIRRERQSAIYEFEAGQQALHGGADTALRQRLQAADAAWTPLRAAAGAGLAAPLFLSSERLLTAMDTVAEHCARIT